MALADAFLAALDSEAPAADPAALEPALASLAAEGSAAWPGIALAPERFCAHVARHFGGEPVDRWPRIHAGDLWLACACASGDERAMAELEQRHGPVVEQVVARMRITGDRASEVKQLLRARLLLGRPDQPPRIATYSGRGALAGWMRAAATRVALNFARLEPRRDSDESLVDRIPAATDDPELRLLKARYAEPFSRAFRDAFASLPAPARLLFKAHYLDGLSTAELGAMHRVHRGTIVRRLDEARAQLVSEAERLLGALLRVPRAELESLLRVVRSRIVLSIHEFL